MGYAHLAPPDRQYLSVFRLWRFAHPAPSPPKNVPCALTVFPAPFSGSIRPPANCLVFPFPAAGPRSIPGGTTVRRPIVYCWGGSIMILLSLTLAEPQHFSLWEKLLIA